MTKMLLLSGSQRRESFNTRLLLHIAVGLTGYAEIDMLDAREADLPLYNQDLVQNPAVVDRVAALHARFDSADAVIVASPEYNSLPSPYLKNVIDWVSRLPRIAAGSQNPFYGCPVLLCSASTGWSGGAVGLTSARTLFGYLGAMVLGDQVCVPHADQSWNGAYYEFNPAFEEYIDAVLRRLVAVTIPRASEVAA